MCGIFFHCVSGIQVLPPWLSHAWFLKFFLMLILCLLVLSATLIQDHYSTHLHLPHYTPLTCFSAQSLLWKHLKHITSPLSALLLARHLQITEMVGLSTTVSWTLTHPPQNPGSLYFAIKRHLTTTHLLPLVLCFALTPPPPIFPSVSVHETLNPVTRPSYSTECFWVQYTYRPCDRNNK